MSGPPTAKSKKKKRTYDDQPNFKRLKLPNNNANSTKKPMPFENTLSLPIQEALYKFREASEQELIRLRQEGLEPSAAINKLVEKMRTIESDVTPCFSRQELDLVMEMAGINEEGAMRALILRSELAKLRRDGFNHPEAINELARRMKRLAGSKRRISLSMAEGALADTKHRKRDVFPSITTPITLSRVSFPQLDSALGDNLRLPLEVPSRKRLQDALMMDEEDWGLRKRPRFFDKDISDSDSSDDVPLDSELYHFDDVGEFSQDEDRDDEEDGEDFLGGNSLEDIPLLTPFPADFPSYDDEPRSSKEPDAEEFEDVHIRFRDVKEEESDSDDTWISNNAIATELSPHSTTSSLSASLPPLLSTALSASAFTPTATSTSTSTSSFISTAFTSTATATTSTTTTITPRTLGRKTTKHRDSTSGGLSQRTIS